jgi:hypothetical protein
MSLTEKVSLGMHYSNWVRLWWAILQHFGRECKKTWGGEVIAVVVGGIAGAATSYLRTRGQISFTNAVIDGLVTAVLFFGIYVFAHLLRSPWLERSSEGVPPSLMDGIVGSIMFLLLLDGATAISYLLAQDWRSASFAALSQLRLPQLCLFCKAGHHEPQRLYIKRSSEISSLPFCSSPLSIRERVEPRILQNLVNTQKLHD